MYGPLGVALILISGIEVGRLWGEEWVPPKYCETANVKQGFGVSEAQPYRRASIDTRTLCSV